MDSEKGRGHRIVTSHDFTDLYTIFDKFGIDGVFDYFKHLSKDIMSPDGIPFPFAKELQEILGLSSKQTLDWLCINIGDVLSGGLSIWHTRETLLALQSGNISQEIVLKILIGSGVKVFFSLSSPNPISLVCGMVDLGALAYYAYPMYSNYFLAVLQPEINWKEILKNTAQVTRVRFAMSFDLEGRSKIQMVLNNEISLKKYITSTTKKAKADGLLSGSSISTANMCDKNFNAGPFKKLAVAANIFASMKIALKKIQTPKKIQNHHSIIDFNMIPSFAIDRL